MTTLPREKIWLQVPRSIAPAFHSSSLVVISITIPLSPVNWGMLMVPVWPAIRGTV